jgi:hypothetical protein
MVYQSEINDRVAAVGLHQAHSQLKVPDPALGALACRAQLSRGADAGVEQFDDRRAVLETPIGKSPPAPPRAEFRDKKPVEDGLVFVSKAGNKPSKDG